METPETPNASPYKSHLRQLGGDLGLRADEREGDVEDGLGADEGEPELEDLHHLLVLAQLLGAQRPQRQGQLHGRHGHDY